MSRTFPIFVNKIYQTNKCLLRFLFENRTAEFLQGEIFWTGMQLCLQRVVIKRLFEIPISVKTGFNKFTVSDFTVKAVRKLVHVHYLILFGKAFINSLW